MSNPVSIPPIGGFVKPGFEAVKDQFLKSFTERGELGAACSIYHKGEKVVDLWGGYTTKDKKEPWKEDTVVLVYSVTKGMSAAATAVGVSKGFLHYEAPVTSVWPKFGQNGKADITIRQLVSERAGMCHIDHKMNAGNMGDLDLITDKMATQKPEWKADEANGNHAYSIGWIHSQLLRKSDPQGRSLTSFFEQEVAKPLGATFHIGLPAGFDQSRIARIDGWNSIEMLLHLKTLPWKMVFLLFVPWSLTFKTLANPFFWNPDFLDQPDFWIIENGGAGGIGDARGLANIYSEFATGGKKLGLNRETLEALYEMPERPRKGWEDRILKTDLRYSMGFEKPDKNFQFGVSDKAFGTFGAGGSFAFADPDAEVGYAYVTNKLGFYKWADPREANVRAAFYTCLGRM